MWLDEQEILPGRQFQQQIEEVIQTTKSAAIILGAHGLGPWQEAEMRSCVSQFIIRRLPVIPVLLRGAAARSKLPLFMREFTWVDLGGGITKSAIDKLVWAITERKPSSRRGRH